MKRLFIISCLASGLCSPYASNAQSASTAAPVAEEAGSPLTKRYEAAVGNNSRLYNGPEYIFYNKLYKTVQGHQFFNTTENQKSEIIYDGFKFSNIPMLYDLHLEQVVITTPTSPVRLRLVNEKISSFTTQGHTFVRITTDPAAKLPISTGFYDLLVDDGFQLLVKREKEMKKKAEQDGVTLIFIESSKFFLAKDSTYYPITSIKSFASLFPEKKADIQKYSRSNKLKFNKKSRESSMLKLAQYAASLSK